MHFSRKACSTIVMDLNYQSFTAIWTSGRRYDNGNKWIWEATGQPVHYTNWRPGQPDNFGGIENCLELVYLPNMPGQIKWNDGACNNTDRYLICEYNSNTDGRV
nr:unnamed protein product [Callosobruchus analis]